MIPLYITGCKEKIYYESAVVAKRRRLIRAIYFLTKVGDIIHLLDSAEPDIRFVVQMEADVGRSEAESSISLDLHNKSNVRQGSVQQVLYYAEITK